MYIFQCGMMSIQVHIPVCYDEYSGTHSSVFMMSIQVHTVFQCVMMSIRVHIPVWYDKYSGTHSSVV